MLKASFSKQSLVLFLVIPNLVLASQEYSFDWNLLGQELGLTLSSDDVDRMKKDSVLGKRLYDIYVNTRQVGSEEIEIVENHESFSGYSARFPMYLLQRLPLKFDLLPELTTQNPQSVIENVASVIEGATVDVDPEMQTLHIQVPQVFYDNKKRYLVNPVLWDYGIPAVRLSYSLDSSVNRYLGNNDARAFLSISSQFNLGTWRLINRSTLRSDEVETKYERLQTYLTRTIPQWKAEVSLGEMSTFGRYMTGIPIKGISLHDDDGQLEPMDRGYLPVITGIADSRAVVTIRQNNRIIHEEEVAAGPFEFAELQGLSFGGDIEVEVRELNGKVKAFVVPYMNSSRLLKTGRFAWDFATGRFDGGDTVDNPWLVSGSLGYGMPGGYTLYSGFLASDIFTHGLLGVAVDGGRLGSLAVQVDHTQYDIIQSKKGTSIELNWYKNYKPTNSSISVSYRHTLNGNLGSLNEAARLNNDNSYFDIDYGHDEYVRNRLSYSLSQSLGRLGTISANGILEKTSTKRRRESQSLNYSFNWKDCSFSFQGQHSRNRTADSTWSDWQVFGRVTVPLHVLLGENGSRSYSAIQTSVLYDENGIQSKQIGLTGTIGKNNEWTYQIEAQEQTSSSYSGSLDYSGDLVRVRTSYAQTPDTKSLSANVSGAMVLSANGVQFADTLSGSIALVHIPDADKVTLLNGNEGTGGWVVNNNLQDYQLNEVRIDPNSIPSNVVMLDGHIKKVVPANDAVMYVPFKTFKGTQALFFVTQENGLPIPFGSEVNVESEFTEMESTVADEDGSVYMVAAPKRGALMIRWRGENGIESCRAPFEVKVNSDDSHELFQAQLKCVGESRLEGGR